MRSHQRSSLQSMISHAHIRISKLSFLWSLFYFAHESRALIPTQHWRSLQYSFASSASNINRHDETVLHAILEEEDEENNYASMDSTISRSREDMVMNRLKSGYVSEGYSRSLDPMMKGTKYPLIAANEEDEDGYSKMFGTKKRKLWKKLIIHPLKFIKKLQDKPKEPGTLILVRHGESKWNANKTFTGWADPDLSETGHREVEHAARLLLEGGYEIDVVFTSRLTRAIRSAWILLKELNEVHIPVFKSWRLNERMYGALTGLSKTETAEKLGAELVQEWRGSLRSRPPPVATSDTYWPGRDRRHFDLTVDEIPQTESLLDCMKRTAPIWEEKIFQELKKGNNVMVVAHANTLRGLVKIIDDIGDEEIQEVAIPTGIPVIYKFGKSMKPIKPIGGRQTASQMHMSGIFLEKPGLLKEALKREEQWISSVPGYNSTMNRRSNVLSPLERSLTKLKLEREMGKWAGQFIDPNNIEDDGSDGNMGRPVQYLTEEETRMEEKATEDSRWEQGLQDIKEGQFFDPDTVQFNSASDDPSKAADATDEEENMNSSLMMNSPCLTSMPTETVVGVGQVPVRKDATIVIIRHGKTEHNKLGLFTGWEDVPLAKEGVEEAKRAGKLLKKHGYEFDVVYTSWLSRAIETAWYVIDELDSLWLPIIKSWRLNERMYGELTGLSKRMVAQRHGDTQFKAWRRGYKVRPPSVNSFSPKYPGNDKRYRAHLKDVRISLRESVIRTIEGGRIHVARKLPKSESLKDCMDRTIPFFAYQIVPEAINQGKRVLISSSENAIRGLLMHLCEIPEEHITELEIPNGLPLIFDVKGKCVKILDDGTGIDPLEEYNFGKAAKYLFRPCTLEDGSLDEECGLQFYSKSFEAEAVKKDIDFIRNKKKDPETIAKT